MKKSNNIDVQRFLEEVGLIDKAKFEALIAMRNIVFKAYPKTKERIMYGGIMFSLESDDFGGLFVRRNHISFEFAAGFMMEDPHGFLEGSGQHRRHLKIRTIEDVKSKNVRFFVQQAV
jgi:hypothetical protein